MNSWLPIALSLGGSLFLSAGTIQQWLSHQGCRQVEAGGSWKVLAHLRWWIGIALSTAGTALQFGALWLGALALVQPLGALHIALTALAMARLRHEALLGPRLWGIVLVTLGTFLCLAGEAGVGPGDAPDLMGAFGFVGFLVVVALGAMLLPRAAGRFAVASGVAYSLAAVAWKAVSALGASGAGIPWTILFASGYVGGFILIQAGFRRGGAGVVNALATGTATALPMIAAATVFHESVSPLAWGGVAVTALGVLLVGRVVPWGRSTS
ncbi:MAG: hypothetical protein H6686_02535 [Fibrobacteria bacterium]|nr:hypothetical protein [Fibrobacteria bacterium]